MQDGGEVCAVCGKHAPPTETNYTLISPRFGWRLTREKLADGTIKVEWHCAECWKKLKETGKSPASSKSSSAIKAVTSTNPPPPPSSGKKR